MGDNLDDITRARIKDAADRAWKEGRAEGIVATELKHLGDAIEKLSKEVQKLGPVAQTAQRGLDLAESNQKTISELVVRVQSLAQHAVTRKEVDAVDDKTQENRLNIVRLTVGLGAVLAMIEVLSNLPALLEIMVR